MQHNRRHWQIAGSDRYVADRRSHTLAFCQQAEDRVVEVEVSGGAFGDEELAVVGIVGRLGHRQQAGAVVLQVDVELVVEVAEGRAAAAGTGRVSALDHEVVDDPVEDRVGEVIAFGQFDHPVRRSRSSRFEQLERHRPKVVDLHSEAAVARKDFGRDQRVGTFDRECQLASGWIETVEGDVQRRPGLHGLVGDLGQFDAGVGRGRCGIDQQLLQRCVVVGVAQVVGGQVVNGHLDVVRVGDDHIAEGDVPGCPDVGTAVAVVVDVLQPGQVAAVNHQAVSRFVTQFVHAEDVDRQLGRFRSDLLLHLVEEAKLASTVRSGGVAEVPGRNLLEIVSRRYGLPGRTGGCVDVGEMEIGLGVAADSRQHQPLFQDLGSHRR